MVEEIKITEAYEVRYDGQRRIAFLKSFRTIGEKDVYELVGIINNDLKNREIRYLLVDTSQADPGVITRKARKALRENASLFNYRRIAIVGATPAIRMVTKVALVAMGKSTAASFFNTEQEALAWLKGDAKR